MVSLFINGKKVEAEPSQTILQAANKVGIHVPTLCHDPRLTPSGTCRMCVVEVEGARSLVASCATPVSEGMKITTHSELVMRSRRLNLELIWSNHPNDCLTCDKTGECQLQKLMYEYEVKTSRFGDGNPPSTPDDSNPAIYRDMNTGSKGICYYKIEAGERVSLIPFSRNSNECFDRPRRRHACAYP